MSSLEGVTFCQGQLYSGGDYSVALYYNGHIVECGARVEDCFDHFGCNFRIDTDACFDKVSESDLLFDDHNGACSRGGQLCNGIDNFLDGS